MSGSLSFFPTPYICGYVSLTQLVSEATSAGQSKWSAVNQCALKINHAHLRETGHWQDRTRCSANVERGLEPGLDNYSNSLVASQAVSLASMLCGSTCVSLYIRLPGFLSPFFMSLLFRLSSRPTSAPRYPSVIRGPDKVASVMMASAAWPDDGLSVINAAQDHRLGLSHESTTAPCMEP